MAKDAFKSIQLYIKVLGAYNRLLEQSFEDRLLSEKDKKVLQKVFRHLEETSVLIDELRENCQ